MTREHARCHACGKRIRDTGERCRGCGRRFHAACMPFHEGFDPRCGRERWLGAVEF